MHQVSITTLVASVRAGKLVSFPTDTVPALAVRPDGAELIFAAKQRCMDKPLILMGASASDLWPFVAGTQTELQVWQQVADRYWPGALTLVLPASDRVPAAMNPLNPSSIGVRVPEAAIARQILEQTGPLATTSANLSGQSPLMNMAEIAVQFPDIVTLLLDELPSATGVPSTVAKWTGSGWEILRQGVIKLSNE